MASHPSDPPRAWLQPDEEVLHVTGRHPLSVVDALLWTTLLLGVLVAFVWVVGARFWTPLGPYALPVTILASLLWGSVLLGLYWRVRTSRYVVTADRVYRGHGRLRFLLVQTTYDKVTDLHVHQSLFGRIWGFGNVVTQTAGTGLAMEGVRDPFGMKRRIEGARRAFVERLLQEHGVAEARAAATAATAAAAAAAGTASDAPPEWVPIEGRDAPPLFRGGPVGYTLVPALASALGIGAVGVFMTSMAAAGGGDRFLGLIGPVMLVFAVITFLQAYVQYRFTRYEVHGWGVVVTSGWLSRRRVETTFDKVTDVATFQGLVGRLLDYGNIKINTAGSNQAPVNFNGLPRPQEVKRLIDEARRRRDRRH